MSLDLDTESEAAEPQSSALEFALGSPASIPEEARGAALVLEVYQILGTSVHSAQQFASGVGVHIGTGLERPFPALVAPADALPFDNLALFEPVPGRDGPTWALRFHPEWGGSLRRNTEERALGSLALAGLATREPDGLLRVELVAGDRVQVHIGNACIVAAPVRPGRPVPAPRASQNDPARMGIFGFVVCTLGILAAALGTIPAAPAATLNRLEDTSRYVQLHLPPPAPPPRPSLPKQAEAAAPGTAGRSRAATHEHAAHVSPHPQDTGLLAILREGEVSRWLGNRQLSEDIQRGVGGLVGTHATGGPGLADRGEGVGGGGKVGSLEYGLSREHGCGAEGCGGGGTGGPGTKKTFGEIGNGGEAIIMGPIDKKQIDEVVRRHLNEVRYCYQRELQRSPSLAGKVSVKFVIAGDGTVSSAVTDKTTLGSAAAESCIAQRFMRMQFPALKGGGVAIIRYPFLFSPG